MTPKRAPHDQLTVDYGIVTRHRWLWPLVDLAALVLYTVRDVALWWERRREQRNGPMPR